LALDEPNETFSTFKSNNIDVSMHPDLAEQLKPFGGVAIDYIDNGPHQRGFTISTKIKPTGADCSGCHPDSGSGCGDENHY
jgi:hypothetical protein